MITIDYKFYFNYTKFNRVYESILYHRIVIFKFIVK